MLGRRGYTHASAASTTYVVFEADDGFEANPRTLELGFESEEDFARVRKVLGDGWESIMSRRSMAGG